MPRDNEIGKCRCPLCNSTKAALRVSQAKLAYVCCDSCKCQLFSRGDVSDAALRALHIPDEPAPAPPPAPAPAPAPVRTAATAPAPAPAPVRTETPPAPAPAKNAMSWGAFPNV